MKYSKKHLQRLMKSVSMGLLVMAFLMSGYAAEDALQAISYSSSSAGSAFAHIHGARPVTSEDEAILDAYARGEAMAEQYLEKRQARVAAIQLQAYVDEDYFLVDRFFSETDLWQSYGSEIDILIRYGSDEELEQYAQMMESGVMLMDYVSSKTGLYSATIGIRWSYSHWTVNDGQRSMKAFCADYYGADPDPATQPQANKVVEIKAGSTKNNRLRQVVYYGYGGPGDVLTKKLGTSGAVVATNLLASYANGITPEGKTNPAYWEAFKADFDLDWFFSLAQPTEEFRVFMASFTKKGENIYGDEATWQPLIYGYWENPGELQIKKASASPELTDQNDAYSLVGATYGLYRDQSCTDLAGQLVIGQDLSSQTLSLRPGTYYLKEISAPKGYALDTSSHAVTIVSDQKEVITMQDVPQMNPISVILTKQDQTTGERLAGAQFRLCFYFDDDKSQREWILETDANGQCGLKEEDKIAGDDFWLNAQNEPALPLGRLTIQEIKAPEGYQLDSTIYTQQITAQGSDANISVYQAPLISNQAISLRIEKKLLTTAEPLAGVTFSHLQPDGKKETMVTDENGVIVLKKLAIGQHTIQETASLTGLQLNPHVFNFEVLPDGTIQSLTERLDGTNLVWQNQTLTVYNEWLPYRLQVQKTNQEGILLADAEFALFRDPLCQEELERQCTDQNGMIQFSSLEPNTWYYLQETMAPPGYRLFVDETGEPCIIAFCTTAQPGEGLMTLQLGETSLEVQTQIAEDGQTVVLGLVNQSQILLPATGARFSACWMEISPLLLLLGWWFKQDKNKEEHV